MTRRTRRLDAPRCRSSTCARRSGDVPARLGPGVGPSAAAEGRAWLPSWAAPARRLGREGSALARDAGALRRLWSWTQEGSR